MISVLHIKNIGIIEDLYINLGDGFNVLTGETGSGKSLIINSLKLISGGRFSKEMIRKGEDYSLVELNIFNPKDKNSIDGNITISREIFSNGKNTCKINGRLVTCVELKLFMQKYIDIHGQNDNQLLLNENYQSKYLDDYCIKEIKLVLNKYSKLYKRYKEINTELEKNLGDDREKERKLSLLQYEFEAIEIQKQQNDEESSMNGKLFNTNAFSNKNILNNYNEEYNKKEEELENKHSLFMNAERISTSLEEAYSNTQESMDAINAAVKSLARICDIDKKYNQIFEKLQNVFYELEENYYEIRDSKDMDSFNEEDRNYIEERLDLISDLKRKYGSTIKEILDFKTNTEAEINRINSLEEYNKKLKEELSYLKVEMKDICEELHDIRLKNANRLSSQINSELQELEMKNSVFSIKVLERGTFKDNGSDDIKFFIKTNLGEDDKELTKIASGGEMSRIMLAIKTVLSDCDETDILIFDEIDTGISGKAAKVVGRKLKQIGKNHQVITITHQPSIAAKGDNNYYIYKVVEGERTHTEIRKLEEKEIIDEIARISNGEVTTAAKKQALELRKSA